MRALQLQGVVPLYQWSIAGFNPPEANEFLPTRQGHPWDSRFLIHGDPAHTRPFQVVAPRVWSFYNSGFPYAVQEGPVWAGRGLTLAASAGIEASWGPLSLTIAPIAFWSQNADFELAKVSSAEASPYAQLSDFHWCSAEVPLDFLTPSSELRVRGTWVSAPFTGAWCGGSSPNRGSLRSKRSPVFGSWLD